MTVNTVSSAPTQYSTEAITPSVELDSGKENSVAISSDQASVTDSISSRAKSIQKINDEFFADGTFEVSETLIDRLAEYGLISTDDQERLLSSSYFSSPEASQSGLETLQSSVESLIERLSELEQSGPLSATLKDANLLLSQLDSSTSSSTQVAQVAQLLADLKSQLATTPVEFSDNELSTLEELDMVLQVANKLGVQNTSSDAINQYLAVYNQGV